MSCSFLALYLLLRHELSIIGSNWFSQNKYKIQIDQLIILYLTVCCLNWLLNYLV